jgi:hypothetical protein
MTTPPPLQPDTFKDQTVGLTIFGILTVIGGVLAALFLVLTTLTALMPARGGAPQQSFQSLIPAFAMYGIASIALTWLGIGSIMKRRWSRTLLMIGSWSGLITGAFATVFMALSFNSLRENIAVSMPKGDPAAVQVILIIMFATMAVIYLIIPGIWAAFYTRRHVKLTCEYYDDVPRWTDRCPPPVLAFALWLGVCAVSFGMMAAANMAIIPFFGTFLHGGIGIAASAFLMLICLYAARKAYLQDIQGWWMALAGIILFSVSSIITYSRHELSEIYRYMNLSPEQLAAVEKFTFSQGGYMYLTILGWVVPALAYLFWIRKHFRPRIEA